MCAVMRGLTVLNVGFHWPHISYKIVPCEWGRSRRSGNDREDYFQFVKEGQAGPRFTSQHTFGHLGRLSI